MARIRISAQDRLLLDRLHTAWISEKCGPGMHQMLTAAPTVNEFFTYHDLPEEFLDFLSRKRFRFEVPEP